MSQASIPTPADAEGVMPAGEAKDNAVDKSIYSNEDIVNALNIFDDEPREPAPEEASGEGDNQDTSDAGGAIDDKDQTPAPEEGREDPVQTPASWKADEKDMFQKLPRWAREVISKREAQRDKVVFEKSEEAAAAAKYSREVADWLNNNLQNALTAAQVAIEADFAGVEWDKLQLSDPVTYMQLDAHRKQRLKSIQNACQSFAQFREQQYKTARQSEEKRMKEDLSNTLSKVKELVGESFEPKAYKENLESYLKSLGAPQEHIDGIRYGYMLELATKSMLYDKGVSARKAAEKKVAAAPKMQTANARVSGNKADLSAARRMIRDNGSSTEAIADALGALGF